MPIEITLRSSRLLRVYFFVLLLLAGFALVRLPLPLPSVLLLTLVVVSYASYAAGDCLAMNCSDSFTRLTYDRDQWFVEIDGDQRPVELTEATVWQFLLALNFYDKKSQLKLPLVLLPDSCSADELRKLRVLLRHFPVLAR